MEDNATNKVWPELPQSAWSETCATLHMWLQIVGKVRMALVPAINHCWNVTLYPTVRGFTTRPMPHGNRILQIDFDFLEHMVVASTSDGESRIVPLKQMTVKEFYRRLMEALESLGTPVKIWPVPSEVEGPIRFDEDETHQAYDEIGRAHL